MLPTASREFEMASATLTSKGPSLKGIVSKPKKPVTVEDMNRESRSPHEHTNYG
jgi:hypothetical protein